MYVGGIQTFVKCPCEIKTLRLSDDEFLKQINDHTLHRRGSEGKSTGKTRAFLNILFKDFEETNLMFLRWAVEFQCLQSVPVKAVKESMISDAGVIASFIPETVLWIFL